MRPSMRATVRGQEDTKWSDGRNRNPSSRAGMEEAADGRAPGQQGFAPPIRPAAGEGARRPCSPRPAHAA